MKVKKLDRRYSMCRFNDYWIALHFEGTDNSIDLASWLIKRKLIDHYGPTRYAMFNNPSPWYNEYNHNDEVIYLRNASMLTWLQLSGVLDDSH